MISPQATASVSISNDLLDQNAEALSRLTKAVQDNDLPEIKTIMSKTPKVVRCQPNLVLEAACEEVVWLLLNVQPNGSKKWQPRVQGEEAAIRDKQCPVNIEESNVKQCFTYLLKKWPKVAKKLLDLFVSCHGMSPRDPQLRVTFYQDLFMEDERDGGMNYHPLYTVAKCGNTSLIMHPVVKSLVYTEKKLSWIHLIIVTLVAVLGTTSLYTGLFLDARLNLCDSYEGPAFFSYPMAVISIIVVVILGFYEIICIFALQLDYLQFPYHIFQWFVIFFFLMANFNIQTYWGLAAISSLWINVMLRLRQSRLFGDFILSFLSIGKTFVQVFLPLMYVVIVLTMCIFIVHYPDDTYAKLKAKIAADATLSAECNAFYEADFFSFNHALDEAMKSEAYELQYIVKDIVKLLLAVTGQTQVNDILLNNKVEWTRTLLLLVTMATMSIIFSNILVGLTVGDVQVVKKEAKTSMVCLDIYSIYEIYFFRKILAKISSKFASNIPLVTICPNQPPQSKLSQIVDELYVPSYTLSSVTMKLEARELATEICSAEKGG